MFIDMLYNELTLIAARELWNGGEKPMKLLWANTLFPKSITMRDPVTPVLRKQLPERRCINFLLQKPTITGNRIPPLYLHL